MSHDDHSIPATPDSITPEWLSAVLRQAGAVEHAKVVSVSVRLVSAGSGFVGQAAHLHLGYDGKESGAPSTVFAKLSSADPAVRENLRAVGLYATEAGFYRDVAISEVLPMHVPRPYLSRYDDATAASVLLIEDLGDARFGDNATGLSPTDTRIAVRQLARIHAHFWESPELREFKWLRSFADDVEAISALYRAMLPEFEKRWAKYLTPSLLKSAKVFADVQTEYFNQYSLGPHTLIHGDYRADNFAFTATPEDGGFVVFDWQTSRRSRGARDLAYLLAGSISVRQRRDTEKSLVELYYETLLAGGVTGYSLEDCARDIRRGFGAPLSTAVIAGGMLDFSSERGADLIRQLLDRLGAALDDYRFAGHLEELASSRMHA